MAGAVLYLAGGSAALLLLTAVTAILERYVPEEAWERLFGKERWE